MPNAEHACREHPEAKLVQHWTLRFVCSQAQVLKSPQEQPCNLQNSAQSQHQYSITAASALLVYRLAACYCADILHLTVRHTHNSAYFRMDLELLLCMTPTDSILSSVSA